MNSAHTGQTNRMQTDTESDRQTARASEWAAVMADAV